MSLTLIELGDHFIGNPLEGEPNYLSAASGVAWNGHVLFSVGDDQAALIQYPLSYDSVSQALAHNFYCSLIQPGVARRIIPGKLPEDVGLRANAKPDFEAMTLITRKHLEMLSDGPVREVALLQYPNGMLLITGSGGMSWGGVRRSIGVVYALDSDGSPIGGPTKIEFNGLHEYLEQHLPTMHTLGELNIEGSCVWGTPEMGMQLILAQRGNCIDKQTGRTGENMLIRLSLLEVVDSIIHDLQVNALELLSVTPYNEALGYVSVMHEGEWHSVKLDFTDLDAIAGDPYSRLIFTAAAEGTSGPFKGRIAGSAIGVLDAYGNLLSLDTLPNHTIKLEGITSWWNADAERIEFLVVDDADDPSKVAKLRGGLIY